MKKIVKYGNDDFIEIETITDNLRFIECMKLYKTHETLADLENALTNEAKEKIRLVF